jgi:hypothetical protein
MKNTNKYRLAAFLAQVAVACALCQSRAFADTPRYPLRASLDQYMMVKSSEIALARSAAPPSISARAEVMVLDRDGYSTAVKGSNGFLCIVERSWGASTDDPEFWNPRVRGPICFNPPAAKTFAPIYLRKTRLVVTGRSKSEIARMLAAHFGEKHSPGLQPGAMCYMMSKQQYLTDGGKAWHPHLMFFVPGSVAKSWGANLPGSPVMASDDPEEGATIFLLPLGHWSDGTPAPQPMHP